MKQNLLRTFLIGSSVSIFPLIYLGLSYNKLTCSEIKEMKIKFGTLAASLPFAYGLVYTILSIVLKNAFEDQRTKLFVLGAIAGELYSLVGHFGFKIPETLLKSEKPNMVHVIAPIMYSIIYGTFVFYLENIIPE